MFSSGFRQFRKMQADKIAKRIFAVSKLIFLTPPVMIGSFRKSPVAQRSTNRNGTKKNTWSELNILQRSLSLENYAMILSIELGSFRRIIKCIV